MAIGVGPLGRGPLGAPPSGAPAASVLTSNGIAAASFVASTPAASVLTSNGIAAASFVASTPAASVLTSNGIAAASFVAVSADSVLTSNGIAAVAFVASTPAASVLTSDGIAAVAFVASTPAASVLTSNGIAAASFVASTPADSVLTSDGIAAASFVAVSADSVLTSNGIAAVAFVALPPPSVLTVSCEADASFVGVSIAVVVPSRRLRNRVVTVELTAAINADGLTETFYLSTDRFSTVAADTPAHRSFHPSLMDPGSIGLNAYSSGRVSGSTKLEVGEVVVANRNGQFDSWLGHSFAGRPVVIRVGRYTGYPANFTTVLTCTADAVEAGLDTVIIRLRDRQYLFSVPAAQARYGGTNALPNGVDGTSSDLKGRVKPLVYGDVTNITPAFVNTTLLVYQVASNPIASINGVYDKGAAKTFTADYATVDQLLGATLTGSEYATCLTAGLFRLGTSPLGQVTADVSEGATAADRTTAQVLKRLALAAGLTSGEVSAADVIAMDAAAPGPVGIFVADESPFSSVMDRVAASVGAYYGFDAEGVLRLGVLVAPTGSYALSLTPDQILDGVAIKPVAGLTSPVWSVTVNHSPVWTTQTTDLAGSVDDDRRAFLALPSRGTTATDAAVRTKHLLAGEMLVDSLIASEAYANAEAARLLTLFKTPRIVLDVPVHLSVLESMSNIIRIGQEVLVTMPRYGFDDGRSLVCIGLRIELAANRAILTLWG